MALPVNKLQETVDTLIDGQILSHEIVSLDINQFKINIRSNSSELLTYCRHYFAHIIRENDHDNANIEIIAIERDNPELDIHYQDWKRESNKKGRKDSFYDIPGGRILRKVRTGLVFLQSQTHLIAAGECLKNKNQLINYINSQYMNWLQNHSAIICHAAGLIYNNVALGMAGFSGGGKSTLMLHMLSQPKSRFLSNDRLFIRKTNGKTDAIGIPKLPRINPGTIVHNPRLHSLISSQQRSELLQLPAAELWELEEKYDVYIDECYGADKIQYQAEIKNFLVLNWTHDNLEAVQLVKIDLNQRRDLLAAIMKSPGPFYQYENGEMYHNETPFNEQNYLDVFQDINVYEVKGGVDFQTLQKLCYEQLMS